jgi:hypothetical protein
MTTPTSTIGSGVRCRIYNPSSGPWTTRFGQQSPAFRYAVKWKRPYYGLPELGWLNELAAYDVSVNVVFLGGADFDSAPPLGTGARARYVKGDDSGGGTTTGAARVGRGGEPHAGLESGAERWLRPQLSRSGSGEGVDVGRVVVCR